MSASTAGQPRQRTDLAWNRTALGLATNGALITRLGLQRGWPVMGAVGLVVVGAAGALYLASVGATSDAPRRRSVLVFTLTATAVAGVAILTGAALALL